jgi:hypothetical protein
MTGLNPTIGGAADALMSIFADVASKFPATADYAGVEVIDGEPTNTVETDYIQFTGFDYSSSPASLGNLRRDEDYDLLCMIRCWTGDIDTGATNGQTRHRAFNILAQVQLEITANPNVNYLIRFWQMSKIVGTQGDQDIGWAVDLNFSIHCEATTEQ